MGQAIDTFCIRNDIFDVDRTDFGRCINCNKNMDGEKQNDGAYYTSLSNCIND